MVYLREVFRYEVVRNSLLRLMEFGYKLVRRLCLDCFIHVGRYFRKLSFNISQWL